MKIRIIQSIPLSIALSVVLFAQMPDLTGTWTLDPARSRVAPAAPLAGLIPAGAPETLHITQAANGTVMIESRINESHVRTYKPGHETRTPVQGGAITMTTRWDGRSLAGDGSVEAVSGASTVVKEVFALSPDKKTLHVEITTIGAAGRNTSSLLYVRKEVVEPCRNWPTPCKGQ
jgi:hypothetical protein